MKRPIAIIAATLGIAGAFASPFAQTAFARRTHVHVTPAPSVAGQVIVWVNLTTGVYHYKGERWYGRTKNGSYMSEADAIKAGYRPTQNGQ
jgi:hypothetical protein